MDNDKKEFGGWFVWVGFLILIALVILTVMGYFGKLTSTIVERKVFENSYQRSEGLRSQNMAWEAQLASINSQLMSNPNDANLMAQRAMLEVQIKGMK